MNNSVSPPNYYILEHHGIKGQKWGVRRFQNKDGTLTAEGRQRQLESRNIPNCKKLTNYKGPMYFISTSNMDDKTLEPRVVDNYFTRNGYEDNTTKRVSFAPSVNRCLMGLSQDVSNKDFYVYEPSDRSNLDIYKPNPKAVPDSSVTGELWVTTPVKLKRVGKIHCTGDDGKEGKKFNYGTHTAELYGWNFEWIADRKNTASVNLGKKYGFVEDNPNKHGHNWKDDWSEEYAIMYRPVKYLAHHGIKGQKWGIRRTPEQLGHDVNKTFNRYYNSKFDKSFKKAYDIKSDPGWTSETIRSNNGGYAPANEKLVRFTNNAPSEAKNVKKSVGRYFIAGDSWDYETYGELYTQGMLSPTNKPKKDPKAKVSLTIDTTKNFKIADINTSTDIVEKYVKHESLDIRTMRKAKYTDETLRYLGKRTPKSVKRALEYDQDVVDSYNAQINTPETMNKIVSDAAKMGYDAIADPIDYGVAGYPLILTSTKNLKTKTAKAQPLSTYY